MNALEYNNSHVESRTTFDFLRKQKVISIPLDFKGVWRPSALNRAKLLMMLQYKIRVFVHTGDFPREEG